MITTVTATKPHVDAKVGLRLNVRGQEEGGGHIVVTKIAPASLFANTALQAGMRILSINGMDTSAHMTAEQATNLIKRIQGTLTIEAARMPSPPPPEPEVAPPPAAPPAAAPVPEPPVIITVTRVKASTSTKIGLGIGMNRQGALCIKRINADSLFADSELTKGMLVQSINGLDLTGFDAEQVTGLVKRVKGDLTIVAQTAPPPLPPNVMQAHDDGSVQGQGSSSSVISGSSTHDSSHNTVSTASDGGGGGGTTNRQRRRRRQQTIQVTKTSIHQKLGMSLVQEESSDKTGTFVMKIHRVDPHGLLGQAGVRPNMRLVMVNNVSVKRLTVPLVGNMMTRISGDLTLVVEEDDEDDDDDDEVAPVAVLQEEEAAPPPPPQRYNPHQPMEKHRYNAVQVQAMPHENGVPTEVFTSAPPPVDDTPPPPPRRTRPARHDDNVDVDVFPPAMPAPVSPMPARPVSNGKPAAAAPPPPPPVATVIAVPSTVSPQPWVEVRAYRPNSSTKVGLRLRCRTNGTILIDQIASDGLFAHSNKLRPGMTLSSVNGMSCVHQSHTKVLQMISETVGELRLVAILEQDS